MDAPEQCQIGVKDACSDNSPAQQLSQQVELVSGPHMRSVFLVITFMLAILSVIFVPRSIIISIMFGVTLTTSALWCTPRDVVISLGPVPVCMLRQRIPYENIASITVLNKRRLVVQALLQQGMRIWQPLNVIYGLTLGKPLIDIVLKQPQPLRFYASQRYLVSVDKPQDIIAHVTFRQENGPNVPLPASHPPPPPKGSFTLVICDAFAMFMSPWRFEEVNKNMGASRAHDHII